MEKKPLLISACLLGEPCRYDGRRVTDALTAGERTSEQTLSLLRQKYRLLPVCPEVAGGLPTPRLPSERVGDRVLRRDGVDVSAAYAQGAHATLRLCRGSGCTLALLKARSPSCGKGRIYDGTFCGRLCERHGVCAELLLAHGIDVYTEDEVDALLADEKNKKISCNP